MKRNEYVIVIIDLKIDGVAFGSTVKTRINPSSKGSLLKYLSDNNYKIAIRNEGIEKITAKKIVSKDEFIDENIEVNSLFKVYKS